LLRLSRLGTSKFLAARFAHLQRR